MKRIFYTLSLLLLSMPLLLAQVPKKILIEEATQASCAPCASVNPGFDAIISSNIDKMVPVKYQVWWPGYDPMYEENPLEVNARIQTLGPTSTGGLIAPGMYANLGQMVNAGTLTQAMVDQMAALTSPISMTIEHTLNDAEGTVDIEVSITNESASDIAANNYRLMVAVQEDTMEYASPPGTNGEMEFHWVMRKFVPDPNGTALTSAIGAGETVDFTFSQPIPWYTKDLSFVAVSAWVENPNTREMLQAERSTNKPLTGNFPDLAVSYLLAGYDGYCDDAVDITFDIRNDGEEEVTSFDVNAVLPDGSLQVINSWTGNIAVGGEEQVVIADVPLAIGANALTATITNINGKPDRNGHNNLIDNTVYYKIPNDPFGEEIDEGFDVVNLRDIPDNMTFEMNGVDVVTVNSSHLSFFNDPLGGHGQSDGAVWFDFPIATPGLTSAMLFDKVDLTESKNTTMTFNYAYALRGTNGADRMIIEGSSDCGDTWTTIWDVFGRDVTTAPATATGTRFFPLPDQWGYSDTLDLSSFDGEAEVIFRFRGISGGAQAFWFDDINVVSNPTVGNVDHNLEASINTFPNPASEIVNVEFSLENAQNVSVTVYDMTGHIVEVITSNKLMTAGVQKLTWTPAQTGVYSIQIDSESGSAAQRVSVFK